MKSGIHPNYNPVDIICGTCGTVHKTRSTRKGPMRVELCSNCHPFYTGEQRIVDTAGQVDRFMKRMQRSQDVKGKKPETVEAGSSSQ